MALEHQLRAISAKAFTANGTAAGVVTVTDATLWKVRQLVTIKASGQSDLLLSVKDVTGATTLVVGPRDGTLTSTTNLAAYTTATAATIEAAAQDRIFNSLSSSAVLEANTYESGPTIAQRAILVDSLGENTQRIVKRKGLPSGSISYMEPYRKGTGTALFFINPTNGSDMNKNAGFTGTPLGIHNGTDTVLWTGSNITGTAFTFNSTDQAQAGTKSVKLGNSSDADEGQFQNSSVISTGSYVSISGWVYLTRWAVDDNIAIRLRNAGSNVGSSVNLSTYINVGQFGAWQQFSIPLSHITSSAINFNQIVAKVVNSKGTSPLLYFDNLQLEESGGSISYTLEPRANTKYHVIGIGITLVDNIDATLANAAIPPLIWNKILGLNQLGIGIVSTSQLNNVLTFTGIFRNHIDFTSYPNTTIQSGGTATTFWVKYDVNFDSWGGTPLILDSRTNDKLEFIVNDNLSGLEYFRILTNGLEEPITAGENDQ